METWSTRHGVLVADILCTWASAAESPYSYLKGVHYARNVKRDSPPPQRLAERTQFGGVVPPPLRSFLLPSAPLSVPLPPSPSPPLPGCRINVRIMKTEYRSPGALTENGALKRLWGNENGGFVLLQTLCVVVKRSRVWVLRAFWENVSVLSPEFRISLRCYVLTFTL